MRRLFAISILCLSAAAHSQQYKDADKKPAPKTSRADAIIRELGLMTPQEIERINAAVTAEGRARAVRPGSPTDMKPKTIRVSLGHSQRPPKIFLGILNSTSVTFNDRTGNPWPIAHFIPPAKSVVDVNQFGANNNTIGFWPKKPFFKTNIQVFLKGENEAIVLDIIAGESTADSKVNAVVESDGPSAIQAFANNISSQATSLAASDKRQFTQFFSYESPEGSKELTVDGPVPGKAWLYKNQMVLITEGSLILPYYEKFLGKVGSRSGYVLNFTQDLTIRFKGQTVNVGVTNE